MIAGQPPGTMTCPINSRDGHGCALAQDHPGDHVCLAPMHPAELGYAQAERLCSRIPRWYVVCCRFVRGQPGSYDWRFRAFPS